MTQPRNAGPPADNPPANGFTLTNSYALGLAGEQVTETGGDGQWLHTNVFVGGQLLATYDDAGVHFHITDWLGSRRVQTNYLGQVEATYQNLPFGEMVPQNNTVFLGATEQHFTGKERDAESGNDYFGARYYGSGTGRFLSPDPVVISPELGNPQSWNKYSYAFNNPIGAVDPDGAWPFYIHNAIDEAAFGGVLSSHDISVIEHESYLMDFGDHGHQQDPSRANEHGMATPGQSTSDAWGGISDWVDKAFGLSQSSSGDESLRYFADAAHTVQDLGSPEHVDSTGNPITWTGGTIAGILHIMRESTPADSWSGIGTSIRNTVNLYALGHPGVAAQQGGADAWANRSITNYVDEYYSTQMPDNPSNPGAEANKQDASRQCALGNPAACD